MAFKLKSPFHVTQVEQSLKKGGVVGQGSNSSVVLGLTNTDIASVEGTQTVSPEPNNESVDNLVKKTEEGVPLGLNPKQEARFKTRKYKKGLRDDARFDRQTEKAERIYERNQFENLDGEYRNPEEAAGIKSDRAEKELEQNQMQKILESNLPLAEREKKINEVRSKSKFYNDKILSDKEEKSQPKDNLVMRNKEEEFKKREEKAAQVAVEQTVKVADSKVETMYKMIIPLLQNLTKDADKREYIYWPDRKQKIDAFIKKLDQIVKSE